MRTVKRSLCAAAVWLLVFGLAACAAESAETAPAENTETPVLAPVPAAAAAAPAEEKTQAGEETGMLCMKIGETQVAVEWEENAAVQALEELCREQALVIPMSMYGGFEQVGPLGTSLPRSDSQTTTDSGDIVLYSGSQLVVFYGSNSWAYTRLGHITDQSRDDMAALLGQGDVAITLTVEAAK